MTSSFEVGVFGATAGGVVGGVAAALAVCHHVPVHGVDLTHLQAYLTLRRQILRRQANDWLDSTES